MSDCNCRIADNAGVNYKRIEYCAMHESAPELRYALEEALRLQAHYAKLLNMHDDGERIAFEDADEWLYRLRFLREIRQWLTFISDTNQGVNL